MGARLGALSIARPSAWCRSSGAPIPGVGSCRGDGNGRAGGRARGADSAAPEVALEWGEVRITAPGSDIRVTKVDVVPLEIEAATSEPLVRARWFTAKSGEAEVEHLLPKPADPHHALFAPHLYVDELRLSDWDVVAYHAGASTPAEGRSAPRSTSSRSGRFARRS